MIKSIRIKLIICFIIGFFNMSSQNENIKWKFVDNDLYKNIFMEVKFKNNELILAIKGDNSRNLKLPIPIIRIKNSIFLLKENYKSTNVGEKNDSSEIVFSYYNESSVFISEFDKVDFVYTIADERNTKSFKVLKINQ